jgi:hypothetical protein
VGSLANLLDPTNIQLPTIEPGAAVANPEIGASGDDGAPAEVFEPFASSASTSAVTALVTSAGAAVAAIAAVAGAAAAAGAAAGAASAASGAASSSAASGSAVASSSAAGSAGTSSSVASGSAATSASAATGSASGTASSSSAQSGASSGSGGSGSNGGTLAGSSLASVAAARLGRFSQQFVRFANLIGRISPLAAKIILNGAYLRSTVGVFYPILPIASVALAIYAAIQNGDQLLPPAWQIFILLAVIGIFDAFAGAIGFTAFALVTVFTAGVNSSTELSLLVAIALIWFGPGLVARAFRRHNFDSRNRTWELFAQVAISSALVGWITTSAVSTLPAIAGKTLVAANHIADFALALAVAVAIRVLLEALIARKDPSVVLDNSLPQTTWTQRILSWLLRFGLFVLIAGAIFGYNIYVLVGAFLFVIPTTFHWFADRLPNSPWLWKLLPTGLPGLNLVLLIAGFTSAWAATLFTGDQAPAQAFMLLPIPLLILAILGLFGRHGEVPGTPRPVLSERLVWIYRIGGVIMLALALKLMGIV